MADYGQCQWFSLPDPFDQTGERGGDECDKPATHDGCNGYMCPEHKCRCAKLLTPEYLARKARRTEMAAVLEALSRAWRKTPEKSLVVLLALNLRSPAENTDADLLKALEKYVIPPERP